MSVLTVSSFQVRTTSARAAVAVVITASATRAARILVTIRILTFLGSSSLFSMAPPEGSRRRPPGVFRSRYGSSSLLLRGAEADNHGPGGTGRVLPPFTGAARETTH